MGKKIHEKVFEKKKVIIAKAILKLDQDNNDLLDYLFYHVVRWNFYWLKKLPEIED